MYNNFKVDAIIQARMTSTRLPGKVLLPLLDKPVLQHIIERLRRSKYIDDVIVATTTNDADQPIIDLCKKIDCRWFRGSEDNVLQRVLDTAQHFKTDIIVEITADCVFVNGEIADYTIEKMVTDGSEYASNVMIRTFPRGFDLQVFYTNTLDKMSKIIDNDIDRQHVSTILYKNPMQLRKEYHIQKSNIVVNNISNYSHIRLTLDTIEDYKLINLIFKTLNTNKFLTKDILMMIDNMPELFEINKHVEQKSYYKELAEWYQKNTKF